MDPEKMFSDNALVSVVNIGPQHYAMCETPFMLQVNTQSLETEERVRCYFFFLLVFVREKNKCKKITGICTDFFLGA